MAHFGLDIGSYSIKAAQAQKKGKSYKLTCFGEIRTPINLASQAETDKRTIAAAIKKLVAEAKITAKEVVLSLSESAVFSQVIELPYLSQTELSAAINFEAEQYIPVPLKEVKLEYLVLSPFDRGAKVKKMEVLLVAAKKTAVNQIVALTEAAGLIPVALETEILSLIRVINFFFKGNCLFLNLGHRTTNIVILENQNLKFTRTLKTAGEAFTRAVARELNMELLQAEQYKVAYGLEKDALEGKVAKAILPTFNVILTEIKKALNFFLQKEPQTKITTLIVSGGGASMMGLNSYLAESLSLEVVTLDPFKIFTPEKRFIELKDRARLSTVIGLAVREE